MNRPRWSAHLTLFVLTLALAAALRLYALGGVPSELIADELETFNSARSIATTGHDVDGSLLPFFYSRFTRNPPLAGIASYVSSLVFGNNPFALRLPAALFGTIAVALLYGITRELTRRRDCALAAALLAATQPILVQFARIAWEPGCELPFLLGGLYVLVRCLRAADEQEDDEPLPLGPLALAALLLGIASYTYMATWVYAVVLAGALFAVNVRRLRNRFTIARVLAAAGIWFVVSAPALWMWFADPLTHLRTHRISVFASGITFGALALFFHNYAQQFDWSYLATTGDPIPGETWRYLAGFGAFFWWVLPLAAIGLLFMPRVVQSLPARRWLWIWIAVYPIGGALTNEAIPSAPRTLAGAPVFCVLAAIGFCAIVDRIRGAVKLPGEAVVSSAALFAGGTLVSTILFARFYFTDFVHVYPNAWDSGTRSLFTLVRSEAPRYSRICFSLYPAFYALDTYVRYYLSGVPTTTIEDARDPSCNAPGTLLVTDSYSESLRTDFTPLATIRDVDGIPFAYVSARAVRG
ncbi:MAG: ArnT family glycosyltransferase [Candidatus Tyrphobacter sp.]